MHAMNKQWHEKNFSFFSHKKCEYYPCHKGIEEKDFNCLFCYCPLYALGEQCGGDFTYSQSGKKDCSNCVIPHRRENYEYIINCIKNYKDSHFKE